MKQKIRFFKPKDSGPRIWGQELLVAHVPGLFTGKILFRKGNAKGKASLQRHRVKNESAYLYSGSMWIYFEVGGKIKRKKLVAGDCYHIPPGAIHAEEAITNCVIFETSTPVFNDREKLNEKYGWKTPPGALPTTRVDEIEIR